MQLEVRQRIQALKASLVVFLERNVKPTSFHCLKNAILPNGWLEVSNVDICSSARIWLLWNPRFVSTQILDVENQIIHCDSQYKNIRLFFSACYGTNTYIERRDLWKSILSKANMSSRPWVLVEDFNTVRWSHEKIACPRGLGLIEFNECLQQTGLLDLKLSGSPFIWSNSSIGDSRIECKLDGMNLKFI